MRARYLYKPFVPLPNLQDLLQEVIEVRIASAYLTKFNKAYAQRHFFGTEIYTSDSDAVCIFQHNTGNKIPDEEPRDFEAVALYFRVVKGRNNYTSSAKNGIRSRKFGQFDGHSIKFESCEFLKKIGSLHELAAMTLAMPTHLEPVELHSQRKAALKTRIACARMPDAAYKAVVPAIVFNLTLEPALLFQLSTFSDKSEDLTQRTIHKLQDNVLYVESDRERLEICRVKSQGEVLVFRFSRVLPPLRSTTSPSAKKPMDEGELQVIGRDLDWSEFLWAERSLEVRGQLFEPLKNYVFLPLS